MQKREGSEHQSMWFMRFLWLDVFCLCDIIRYKILKNYIKYLIPSFNFTSNYTGSTVDYGDIFS